jgi:putative peptidoglycan lipid II flippase
MRSNLRNIGLVSAVTMLSRVLGLARDILITGVFGTSALASAFVTAFTLPNLFRRLLGEGALTAALVPTLKDELTTGSRVGAFRVLNQVLSWLLAVTVLLVMGAMLGLTWFESHALKAAAGGDPTWARWALGARLAVWLFPYLALVCLAAAFSAALQTLHRFLEPALSPIWLNLAMIGALGGSIVFGWAQTGDARMAYLCGGVLVGGALQLVVPAWALWTEGWRPRWDVTLSGPLRGIGRLMGPTVLGSAIYLVNMAVARLLGLSLNESAAAVLNLAARLMELPIGVFAIAVTTVVFPVIAQHAAAGDRGALAAAYRQGLRLILLVNVPAAVGLAVLAEPIIRVLFQRGAFGAEDTALMMPVLVVFAAGLPFLAVVSLMLRGFYAHTDARTHARSGHRGLG